LEGAVTRRFPSTKFPKPPDFAAQARRFAEIAADCSRGILPGDYGEAGISAFAAEIEEIFWKMRLAEADRRSEQPPAVAERKPRGPSISTMIEQAKRAGATITMPDGTKLDFSKPESAASENPWPLDDFKVKQ
jgi:hypothetical protein